MADIYVRVTGNDTTGTGSAGSPYASPGKAVAVAASGDRIRVGSGTYNISTNTENVSGGFPHFVSGKSGCVLLGEDTGGGLPVLKATAAVSYLIKHDVGLCRVESLTLDLNALATYGIEGGNQNPICIDVQAVNNSATPRVGTGFSANCVCVRCRVTNLYTGFDASNNVAFDCEAVNCQRGFSGNVVAFCTDRNCTEWGGVATGLLLNHTSYGCAGKALHDTTGGGGGRLLGINCLALAASGRGVDDGNLSSAAIVLMNCAGWNNAGGNYTLAAGSMSRVDSFVSLTGDPTVSGPAGNLALNNTAGAGAACRAAGIPGAFPGGTTTGYLDIGAAQHQDSGGSPTTRAY